MIPIDKTQAPAASNQYHFAHAKLLIESFHRLCGVPLIDLKRLENGDTKDAAETARAKSLYCANFVVVSHGVERDPIFNYANKAALALFEMDWHEFVSLPSRKSAQPMHRDERDKLMKTVSSQGFIDNYAGVRTSSSGKRFAIKSAVVWNLIDQHGILHGQAATFSEVDFL